MRSLEEIDRDLSQAQERLDRRNRLETVIQDLRKQSTQRWRACAEAMEVLHREEADVEELQRISLASFVARLQGHYGERLDQEKREAAAAKARYDAAAWAQKDLEDRLQEATREQEGLWNAEAAYRELLAEKENYLLSVHAEAAPRLLELSGSLSAICRQLREVEEAIAAGEDARTQLNKMLESLHTAADWGVLDVVGGGFLATLAKHDHLETAQQEADQVRQALSRFCTELADVSEIQVPNLQLDDFAVFADYFFDGLFSDLYVQSQIDDAQKNTERTLSQIEDVLNRLEQERIRLKEDQVQQEQEREQLLRKTEAESGTTG